MQIYGIDVSSEYLDLYYLNTESNKVFSKRISNKINPLLKFLKKLDPESILCAEHTGVYSDLLVGLACCCGIKIALIEGYVIHKSFAGEKGKSDQIDAKRIWEYGTRFFDKLTFVNPASETLHELRELQNLRNQFVKQRKMIKTSNKGKQKQLMNSIVGNKSVAAVLYVLNKEIKALDTQMQHIICSNPTFERNYNLAKSVIGVGDVIATELIIYTENFTKIKEAKKAASFAGVCPFPSESGKIKKRPKVPKRSNKKLKSLLFLAALNMSKFSKEIKLYKERKMAEGKHYFLVMNNIANKLLKIIFAIVKSGKPYDQAYICIDPRKT